MELAHDQKNLFLTEAPVEVSSAAFMSGDPIPVRYTQDGENVSPPLAWGAVPEGTQSLVLMVEDPDAPSPKPFVHWLLAELEPSRDGLPEALPASGSELGVQGDNSMGKTGYLGPSPPRHDPAHHYHFQLFALDCHLDVEPGFGRTELLRKMAGHVLAFGETVGTYVRSEH